MTKPIIQRVVKCNAPVGVIIDILQKMVDIANKENAFTYEWLNGTLTVVEPGMTAEQALQFVHAVRKEEIRVEFFGDGANGLSPTQVAKKVENLVQYNDMVIFPVAGGVFRVSHGATAEDIMKIIDNHQTKEQLNLDTNKLNEQTTQNSIAKAMQQNQFDDR